MSPYWVRFVNGSACTVNAENEIEAGEIALQRGDVRDVRRLPYPATPEHNPQKCPAFCYAPEQCAGRTACPQRHSCTE